MKPLSRALAVPLMILTGQCCLFSLGGSLATGTVRAADVMSPEVAQLLGLEEAWRRQIQVPAGEQSIADQQLFVHVDSPRAYVEIRQKGGDASIPAEDERRVLLRIATDQLGTDGTPIGVEEAQRLARAEMRRLARRKIDAEITERSVPRVSLFTASSDGTIERRNAETGSPIWMNHVGSRYMPYGTMGINDQFLTITNGGNLIKLDMEDGEEINTVATIGTPLFGAIHSGDFSLVATIRSSVEGYPLRDTTRDPFSEVVAGLALAPPRKAPDSTRVGWATDSGFFYAMELSGVPSVLFRLNTDGIVSGRVASAPGNRFFFGSENGQVYGVRATRTGEVLWNRPYGEPFYNAPMVVEDQLLIRSAYGSLYSLDVVDGTNTWENPISGVDELVAAFDSKVYIKMLSGALGIVDLESGKLDHVVASLRPERLLVNEVTNRLYLVSRQGTVQCLRPIDAALPSLVDQAEPDSQPKDPATDPTAPAGNNMTTPQTDPFGATPTTDPFGATPAVDPFAAPAGGGGGGAPMDDPFAAPAGDGAKADDPFGGDPFGN